MTRVAAVDCGTNSVRLLVTDLDGDPRRPLQRDLVREMRIVRLGEGVDRTGELSAPALERTFAALREFAGTIRAAGAVRVRMVATSATRDARNREVFVEGVRELLGVRPHVASGAEEAALSFAGATRDLDPAAHTAPYLVVDIGGGSTEFVFGATEVEAARSVDIGCVRLTERFVHDDPVTAEQLAALESAVDAALDEVAASVPLTAAATVVGLAGTVTTVAGIALGLPAYDAQRIHHSRISTAQVEQVAELLCRSDHATRAALPVMHPGRVDVIAAGSVVLRSTLRRCGAEEVLVSEHDILDGIALSAAALA